MPAEKSGKQGVPETLRSLQVAIRASSLYTVNHPTSLKAINTAISHLQKFFEEKDVINIQIANSTVFWDKAQQDRDNIHVKNFVAEVSTRNVVGLTFQRKLTMDEFKGFMRVISLKAAKTEELGGMHKALAAENIQNIRVGLFTPDSVAGAGAGVGGGMGFGGVPLLPEMAAFANYFTGKESGLAGFEERFFRETDSNPAFIGQLVSRAAKEVAEAEGEHWVVHYLRSLEKIATAFSAKVGPDPEALRRVLIPVALSFDQDVKHELLTLGREYATSAGGSISEMYPDIMSEIVADRIRHEYVEGKKTGNDLGDRAIELLKHLENSEKAVGLIEKKLVESGMAPEQIGDVVDQIHWSEYTVGQKLGRIMAGEKPWARDFDKVHSTLVELVKGAQLAEATSLVRSYVSGLRAREEEVRRLVAERCTKLLDPFREGPECEKLADFLGSELSECLRVETAVPACEAMAATLGSFVQECLKQRQFKRARDLIVELDEMRLGSDVEAWKADLVRKALRGISDTSVISVLTGELHGPDGARDPQVANLIRTLGASIVEPLISTLGEEKDRSKRARLVEAIMIVGQPGEDFIISALNDRRWYLVRNLAIMLGEIGGERSVSSLEKVIYHRDSRVSRVVVRALIKIGSPAAYRALARALEIGPEDLRLQVIASCAVPGNEAILPGLAEIARAKPQASAADAVRKRAIEGLGKIGSPQAVPVLADLLEKRSLFSMAEESDTRLAAVRALGAIDCPEAREALARAAHKDPKDDVRREAMRWLGEEF
ncbi:MAG: HEAT repeat domain-containing protein [Acidobacteriota bacterium]